MDTRRPEPSLSFRCAPFQRYFTYDVSFRGTSSKEEEGIKLLGRNRNGAIIIWPSVGASVNGRFFSFFLFIQNLLDS